MQMLPMKTRLLMALAMAQGRLRILSRGLRHLIADAGETRLRRHPGEGSHLRHRRREGGEILLPLRGRLVLFAAAEIDVRCFVITANLGLSITITG